MMHILLINCFLSSKTLLGCLHLDVYFDNPTLKFTLSIYIYIKKKLKKESFFPNTLFRAIRVPDYSPGV